MQLRRIPQDINVEMLLDYFTKGNCKVSFRGHHKRNEYNDIISIEEADGVLSVDIARDSIYHILPEYMFHPIDRYSNLLRSEEKELFSDEYEKQEQEKERASRFFAPIDLQLLLLKIKISKKLRDMTEGNKVLLDIILGDRLSEKQRNNRFIKRAKSYLPYCKMIRGNKTLLTFLLRKVFIEEGITINIKEKKTECLDIAPQYADGLDAVLNDSFVGNVYDEMITTYSIHYWSYDECNEEFLQFVSEIEVFKHFIEDYFVSVEGQLQFDITHDKSTLRLSDDIDYNYLNYNTNL